MREFNSMRKEGMSYEKVVRNYFVSQGFKIEDLSSKTEFQEKDIDFSMGKYGKVFYVEVKADTKIHQTGNIVIEDGMIRKGGYKPGWLYKCEADILCFVDRENNIAYLLDWQKIRSNIDDYAKKIEFDNKFDNCKGIIYLLSVNNAYKYDLVFEKIQL